MDVGGIFYTSVEMMSILEAKLIAKSKTLSVEYTVEWGAISPELCAEYEDRDHFCGLCRNGCKNYGQKWSCPPNSPLFTQIASKWAYLYVIYMRMPLAPFSEIKNKYLRVKAANSMLKSRADRYMRAMADKCGKYISTGSCRLCRPCKFKEGKPCAHPDVMAYSFEALGIDVGALVDRLFDHPLLWYEKGVLPEYTSVVCGLLTNDALPLEYLKEQYLSTIKDDEV